MIIRLIEEVKKSEPLEEKYNDYDSDFDEENDYDDDDDDGDDGDDSPELDSSLDYKLGKNTYFKFNDIRYKLVNKDRALGTIRVSDPDTGAVRTVEVWQAVSEEDNGRKIVYFILEVNSDTFEPLSVHASYDDVEDVVSDMVVDKFVNDDDDKEEVEDEETSEEEEEDDLYIPDEGEELPEADEASVKAWKEKKAAKNANLKAQQEKDNLYDEINNSFEEENIEDDFVDWDEEDEDDDGSWHEDDEDDEL